MPPIEALKEVATVRRLYRLGALAESSSSWPGLSRPSTSSSLRYCKNVDARDI
jgi:hypothetical protein